MSNSPMIQVEHLTRQYAGGGGIRDIHFTVERGEIVGLLGPNGAGKSTTMRILSCFMPADSGVARIAGLDVFEEADEVRRRIGYMPENNPLYTDMRVRDYLKFRGRLKGVRGARLRDRIDAVVQQCGLTEVTRRIIGHLSKGFRQRVGLADALVHEPELVILDEPTIGLDPIQIRSVRQLITELGKQTTVLLSTHILPEVEMTCNRVVILHEGRVLAADTTANLQQQMARGNVVVAEIAAPAPELQAAWKEVEEVEEVQVAPAGGPFHRCTLTLKNGRDFREDVFALVRKKGWTMRELRRNAFSLEDIFVQMTRPRRPDEEEEDES